MYICIYVYVYTCY